MKLTERERAVLGAVAMDANQSHRVVSEVTGLRESNIRYTLGSLLDRRLIARHYYIDLFRIGFRYYDLYFTMPTSLWARKDDVVAHILAQPQTAFFCEHTGVYQFDVAVSDRSHRGVQDLIESLGARFPDIFAQREVVIARSLTDFLPWPLEQRDPRPTLRIEASPTSVEVDAVDLRILGFLSTEPVARAAELARRLQMPQATIAWRLARLRSTGVIKGERYLLNFPALGLSVFSHHVRARALTPPIRERIFTVCGRNPHVNYIREETGSFDLSIGTVAADPAEHTTILRELLGELEGCISSVSTSPVSPWYRITNLALDGVASPSDPASA